MRLLPLCAAASALLAGCALGPTVEHIDREWKGNVSVRGVEVVPEGTTLVIHPGTKVRFTFLDEDADGWGDAGLLVEGRILALGTKENPIVFEAGDGNGLPGRWGEIRLESEDPSAFRNCLFSGAQWALHAHFTSLRVESSLFRDNNGGVKFRGDPVEIYGSTFAGNGTAIRYWESSPEIISNNIRENGTGIFARLGSDSSLVRNNNFIDNLDYHIKLGELQDADIDARFNYWGGDDPERLEEKFFDRKDVSYLGKVIHEPAAATPFVLEENTEAAGTGTRNSLDAGR
jgi:hypothetical protein